MIQPAALPAVPGLPIPANVLSARAIEGMNGTDFGALLTIESVIPAAPDQTAKPTLEAQSLLPVMRPTPAILPDGGKDLPLELPVDPATAATSPAPQSMPETASMPAQQSPSLPAALTSQAIANDRLPPSEAPPEDAPVQRHGRPPIGPDLALASESAQPATGPAPVPQVAERETPYRPELSVLADLSIPIAFSGAVVTLPASAVAKSDVAQPTRTPHGPQIISPILPEAETVPASAQRAATATPIAGGQPHEQNQALSAPLDPAPAPIALPALTLPAVAATRSGETRLRLPLLAQAAAVAAAIPPENSEPQPRLTLSFVGAALPLEDKAPLAALPRSPQVAAAAERPPTPAKVAPGLPADLTLRGPEPMNPVTIPTAPAVQTQNSLPPFSPAETALRPHDFTQLVDRLVAARELAAPQAFQVAVQHGEFGPIQLRFRHEGEGLSIAMASADPEFARAVSAAPAPVLPALPVETPAQSGSRFENSSQNASSSGQSAQQRGGSPERREERHGAAENPAPQHRAEGRAARRTGIFA